MKNELELRIDKFTFETAEGYNSRLEALLDASKQAERLLYSDIYGALELDLVKGWGKPGPTYPEPETKIQNLNPNFNFPVQWRSNWHIPPYEYWDGIRWIPLDGNQVFDIKAETFKKSDKHYARTKLVVYMWNDERGFDRTGCLIDIPNRVYDSDKFKITEALTSSIKIDMDKNTKMQIQTTRLSPYGVEEQITGFEFEPDSIGDIGHRKIEFKPIDMKQRKIDYEFRDR